MAEYRIYLKASLPLLQWGGAPPLSEADFLKRCQAWLSPEEVQRLQQTASGGAPSSPAIALQYHTARAGWAYQALRASVSEGSSMTAPLKNPLEAQLEYMQMSWDWLAERERRNPFGPDSLIAYFLQLRLVEQRASMESSRGRAALAALLENAEGGAEDSMQQDTIAPDRTP